jgi:hypothetical protein
MAYCVYWTKYTIVTQYVLVTKHRRKLTRLFLAYTAAPDGLCARSDAICCMQIASSTLGRLAVYTFNHSRCMAKRWRAWTARIVPNPFVLTCDFFRHYC